MAATAVELYCFAGPLDGKSVLVAGKTYSDGKGGVYKRERFNCGNQWRELLIHESVDCSRVNNSIVCRAIAGGG